MGENDHLNTVVNLLFTIYNTVFSTRMTCLIIQSSLKASNCEKNVPFMTYKLGTDPVLADMHLDATEEYVYVVTGKNVSTINFGNFGLVINIFVNYDQNRYLCLTGSGKRFKCIE